MSSFAVPHVGRPVHAVVEVPGSKSLSNRALVCAGLADGETEITGLAPGDDTLAMIECLHRLGIRTDSTDAPAAGPSVDAIRVWGTGGRLVPGPVTLPARLAGTTSRFITAVAALGPGPYTVDGDPPLRARPMGPLHDALRSLGAEVASGEQPGHLPVTVVGPPRGGRVRIAGDVSSQYLSALMLIGPLLDGGIELEIGGTLVSRPYVELTAAVMASFGLDGVEIDEQRIAVPGGRYLPTGYAVEPDASSASYPLALGALLGGAVTVPGLTTTTLQGDARFVELLGQMGCTTITTEADTTVTRDPATALRGIDVDMADVSDLVPTVAAVAVTASTPTRIRGVGFIRGKESDRLGDLAIELGRLGAAVSVVDDGLDIDPVSPGDLHGAVLATHHDHRLAMAFGVLGAAVPGVELDRPEVVTKSWPRFWEAMSAATAGEGT